MSAPHTLIGRGSPSRTSTSDDEPSNGSSRPTASEQSRVKRRAANGLGLADRLQRRPGPT